MSSRSLKCTAALAVALASVASAGCGSVQRPADVYHADVKAMLESQSEPIRICYEKVLKSDPKAAGIVTVHFMIFASWVDMKNEYGTTDRGVVAAKTTAPTAVSDCVVKQLHNLRLEPEDKAYGDIVWSWEFSSTRVQLTPTRLPQPTTTAAAPSPADGGTK